MTYLQIISNKIMTLDELKRALLAWRLKNNTIVFTNGCFDILHLGHIDYLSKAKDLGGKLIVGINTDSSVKRLGKGDTRPINNETSRAMLVASLQFVDAVILFNEDTPYELIKAIEPDVLVKGADYSLDKVVGADIVLARGGKVELISYLEGYSTTAIEKKIKEGK
ncbi:MAG: D-glycero-beta-D-manno-heptose 1-phosphate adenylyltransferase [Bacteroidia bacterium]